MMATIDLYRDLESKYNDRIAELRNKQTILEASLSEAYASYTEAIASEVNPEGKGSPKLTAKAREAIENIKAELKDIQERVEVLEGLKQDKLKALFPSILKEYSVYSQEVYDKQMEEGQKLKELRCQVLLKAKQVHDIGRQARNLYQDISNMAMELGVEFKVRYNAPNLPMTANFEGVFQPLIALPNEVTEAVQLGKVANFVKYYEKTGKFVPEDIARNELEKGVN
jgi:hypothetical protein